MRESEKLVWSGGWERGQVNTLREEILAGKKFGRFDGFSFL